tara:strand:+ start:1104 stop:2276 length:1173 start_codon:yes stop_codon:yes gene_type:complete
MYGATLVIRSDDVFKNKDYMKGVETVTVHSDAIVSEFPTQEMVNSPILRAVNILGKVRKFRGDLLKKLQLQSLTCKVHIDFENFEPISNISDPLVLRVLRIEAIDRGSTYKYKMRQKANLLKQVSKAKNLRYLTLDGLHIFRFPDASFFQFPKLKYLNIQNNYLYLPSDLNGIDQLQNLEELNLSWNNEMKRLPDSITKLKKLKRLNLEGLWDLESLPNNIGNMNQLVSLEVSHKGKINIPDSILKLRNNARIKYTANPFFNNSLDGTMNARTYYNRWKIRRRVPIKYINHKIPNNGASNSISYVNFNAGNTAMRIKNTNRAATYMSVNTFNQLGKAKTNQSEQHIYKRRGDIKNIQDVYILNGNTNVFINPMTTKMVKRGDIDFVKFVH